MSDTSNLCVCVSYWVNLLCHKVQREYLVYSVKLIVAFVWEIQPSMSHVLTRCSKSNLGSVLLHRCHCSCCCLQYVWSSVWLAQCSPVRMHRWSSLCSPARYTTLSKCCLLPYAETPLKPDEWGMYQELFGLCFLVCKWVLYTNSLCLGMCVGGEWSLCVLCTHSLLLHHRGGDPGALPKCWLPLSQTSAEGG